MCGRAQGGMFVFSDLMETDFVKAGVLDKVYSRIGLKDMATPAKYPPAPRAFISHDALPKLS